jgi:hypothetical protein
MSSITLFSNLINRKSTLISNNSIKENLTTLSYQVLQNRNYCLRLIDNFCPSPLPYNPSINLVNRISSIKSPNSNKFHKMNEKKFNKIEIELQIFDFEIFK